ncbi:MAG: alanine racemase, partial [Patescibacteria group bacterium]
MRALFRALRKRRFSYQPLVEVRVYRDHLLSNFKAFQKSCQPCGIAPVLKSNAYGHGLVEVATVLQGVQAPFFCVDSYAEALVLRNEGIRTPLLVIGYTPIETIVKSNLPNTTYLITSLDQLQELTARAQRHITVHIKIDTGMHRQGIMLGELSECITLIQKNPHISCEGIATHLADADNADELSTQFQIKAWNETVQRFRQSIPTLRSVHCAATAGSAYSPSIDANVVRVGIGIYGIPAGASIHELQPVLELKTIVSGVKKVSAGSRVGYNGTFQAPHDMLLATIPVGYAEGLDRRLSNKGVVLINSAPCPIVGRVSMNITTIDATNCPSVRRGDDVIVYSAEPQDPNSISKCAEICETIPWVLLVHI